MGRGRSWREKQRERRFAQGGVLAKPKTRLHAGNFEEQPSSSSRPVGWGRVIARLEKWGVLSAQ